MSGKGKTLKSFILINAAIFIFTAIGWSMPKSCLPNDVARVCLRQQAVLERGGIGREPVFKNRKMVQHGFIVEEGEFIRPDRSAFVRVLTINPRLHPVKVWVDKDAPGYDCETFAKPGTAEKISKEPKELPGVSIEQFVTHPPEGIDGEILFAGNADQFQFQCPNTLYIISGRPITKTAPGMHQTREEFEASGLNGEFYVFVLDMDMMGAKAVEFTDGKPLADIGNIGMGVANPTLILHGDPVVDKIEYAGDKQAALKGNQVTWNPNTRLSSFSAIGDDVCGNIVYMTASDLSLKAEVGKGIYIADLCEIARQKRPKVRNLFLCGGSFDAQQFVAGVNGIKGLKLPPLITSSGGLSAAGDHSASQEHYEQQGGRPLCGIFYALASPQNEADGLLTMVAADESLMERFYGSENWQFIREHIMRVARTSLLIAQHMDIPEQDQALLVQAALLHDIGFLGKAQIKQWMQLRNHYKNEPDLMLAIKNHRPEIVAAKLREWCARDGISLGVLKNNLEEVLEKAYRHGEYGAERLNTILPQDLERLHIYKKTLADIFPIIYWHAYPSRMPQNTTARILDAAHILAVADSIEAANSRQRGELMYYRDRESLEDTLSWQRRKAEEGNTDKRVVDTVERLIFGRDPEMMSIIFEAREAAILPEYDEEFIKKAQSLAEINKRLPSAANYRAMVAGI